MSGVGERKRRKVKGGSRLGLSLNSSGRRTDVENGPGFRSPRG